MTRQPGKPQKPKPPRTMVIDGTEFPFRPRSTKERQDQISRSGGVLEYLRKTNPEEWPQLTEKCLPVGTGIRELKEMVKNTLHQCSESRDYMHTPDFVTRKALLQILAPWKIEGEMAPAKVPQGGISRKTVCFEHMLPDKEMLRRVVNQAPATATIARLLGRLAFTALVSKKGENGQPSEQRRLDSRKLKAAVPVIADVFTKIAEDEVRVPDSFLGLLRYEAAGIPCTELHPLNRRAEVVLRKYAKWRKRRM